MQLKHTSIDILNQLILASKSLDDEAFRKPLAILSGNTIGKHIRHIIEFYDLMIVGLASSEVNYDQRSHDKVIEENRLMAIEKLNTLKLEFEQQKEDKPLTLLANYSTQENEPTVIKTSFFRELQYNIEHAIHHMAIIKIAITHALPKVQLPEHFGIAYSTIKYRKEQCAQ